MSGKSATFENDLLKLIFNGTPIAGLADNATASPLTNLYMALHTADPTDAGDQSSSEATYTGYARVPIERSSSGWTVTANSVSPSADVTFGTCTAGSEELSHVTVGTAASGAGKVLYHGALPTAISVAPGVTPIIAAGSTITEG